MTNKTIKMTDALHEYMLLNSLHEHPVLAKLRAYTATLPNATMQIAPEQGQFMQLLIRLLGAVRTIEVGVFTGYSALSVALVLPPEGKIIACDVSEPMAEVAKTFWEKAGVREKIDLRLNPAQITLQALIDQGEAEKFDFAFIDADKANYSLYYEQCLTLIRKGGIIAIDNVFWGGEIVNAESTDHHVHAIRAFNEKVFHDPRVMVSMVPIADGLTLAYKLG